MREPPSSKIQPAPIVAGERFDAWDDLLQASLLTALAGFVDAIGYTATGHLYLSFMSGNSSQFGMAVAQGDTHVIIWAGAVIAAFVLGAFLGTLLSAAEARAKFPLVLAAEFLCIIITWSLLGPLIANEALLFVAIAMGIQNSIRRSFAGAAIGKTFVTGTLFSLGDALARACFKTTRLTEASAHGISWLSLIAGLICGALAIGAFGLANTLLIAAAAVLYLMLLLRNRGNDLRR